MLRPPVADSVMQYEAYIQARAQADLEEAARASSWSLPSRGPLVPAAAADPPRSPVASMEEGPSIKAKIPQVWAVVSWLAYPPVYSFPMLNIGFVRPLFLSIVTELIIGLSDATTKEDDPSIKARFRVCRPGL